MVYKRESEQIFCGLFHPLCPARSRLSDSRAFSSHGANRLGISTSYPPSRCIRPYNLSDLGMYGQDWAMDRTQGFPAERATLQAAAQALTSWQTRRSGSALPSWIRSPYHSGFRRRLASRACRNRSPRPKGGAFRRRSPEPDTRKEERGRI